MSFTATRWAWGVPSLRPSQKLLLLALADRADDSGVCWPSLARLQKDTGLDIKTIRAGLARLCALGLISRNSAPGRGYVYALPAPLPYIAAPENGPPVPIVPPPLPQRAGDPCRNGPLTPARTPPQIYQEPTMNRQKNLKDMPPSGSARAERRAAPPSPAAQAASDLQVASAAQDDKTDSSAVRASSPQSGRFGTAAACSSAAPFAAVSSPPGEPAPEASPKSAPKPAPKEAFGRFGHVRLTREEHAELIAEHGERGERAVAKLDLWLGARGDRYKSHYMAIHSWVLKAVDEDVRREEALAAGSSGPAPFYGASGPSGAPGPRALPPGASHASGASGAAFISPQPSTYAQLERANQKNVARLALLGRGVYQYGKQTDDYGGTVHDVDPVQPAGG